MDFSQGKSKKFVYHFSAQKTEGSKDLFHLLGGKGAHLAEMTSLKLPVPPGFTITADMSVEFYKNKEQLADFFKEQIRQDICVLEKQTGLKFGSIDQPLLLSVRSGSKVSMPGMMDTILNLGLNTAIVEKMACKDARLAWDCYRRLISMYGDIVLGADASMFIFIIEDYKAKKNYSSDADLTAEDFKQIALRFKEQILQMTGGEMPENPEDQLFNSICAVFKSWNNARAIAYRKLHSYPDDLGTAVNVQTMVFGNRGKNSATGVVFTRNPSTGERGLFGEFLPQAQGEDVVAGIRTPLPVAGSKESLQTQMPHAYKELQAVSQTLEKHFKDMQDIEFTVEEGKLWILQTRKAKRTVQAYLRTALDFVQEGLMTKEEALTGIPLREFETFLHPALDPEKKKNYLCKGLPASPGGAGGQIVFSAEQAHRYKKTILVRRETSPDDIKGMISAQGILTACGGMTSHAAVVARGMGKCCVVGCHSMEIDVDKKECVIGKARLKEGDFITLDGSTGEIYQGKIPMIQPQMDQHFEKFMQMTDRYLRMKVKANADTPADAKIAKNFRAEGIGLCRTEHMFFLEDRLDIFRRMIIFQDHPEKRKTALDQLLIKQKEDFLKLFQVMEGQSVCIRLLDPPLHEFLPGASKEISELAQRWSEDEKFLSEKIEGLKEVNPMLGHRGCRLAVTFPELYQHQARAVALAGAEMIKQNKKCSPEIMIPLVGTAEEFLFVKNLILQAVEETAKEAGVPLKFPIGTMIEIPQSALRADELAREADFFSIGSNDLTQSTLGLSRDDCAKFLPGYMDQGIITADPFVQLETKSVGVLISQAVQKARSVKKTMPISLCGEHGANPKSISFLNDLGLTAVSCSPYRIPVARLAIAQTNIRKNNSAKKSID